MTDNDGEYDFEIDELEAGYGYYVEVTAGGSSGSSDAFTIAAAVDVTSPTADSVFITVGSNTVEWSTAGDAADEATVTLALYDADGNIVATVVTDNDGEHDWEIDWLEPGEGYRITVTAGGDGGHDGSSEPFDVAVPIEVTAPAAGASYEAGDVCEIRWKTSGGASEEADVNITLWDGSERRQLAYVYAKEALTIASSTPNDGTHEWHFDGADSDDGIELSGRDFYFVITTASGTHSGESARFSLAATDGAAGGATQSGGKNTGASGFTALEVVPLLLCCSCFLLCLLICCDKNKKNRREDTQEMNSAKFAGRNPMTMTSTKAITTTEEAKTQPSAMI